MTPMRIDHVQLAIPPGGDAKARAFWIDIVGMAEVEKPEALRARGGLWLRLGAAELHLGVELAFRPAEKAHPCFAVPDLDVLNKRFRAAGHATRSDDLIPGRARFYVADPFGNRVEFVAAE